MQSNDLNDFTSKKVEKEKKINRQLLHYGQNIKYNSHHVEKKLRFDFNYHQTKPKCEDRRSAANMANWRSMVFHHFPEHKPPQSGGGERAKTDPSSITTSSTNLNYGGSN